MKSMDSHTCAINDCYLLIFCVSINTISIKNAILGFFYKVHVLQHNVAGAQPYYTCTWIMAIATWK